jgi:hypothetical protein
MLRINTTNDPVQRIKKIKQQLQILWEKDGKKASIKKRSNAELAH